MTVSEPFISLWFGNFYRPAFDDQGFIDESMAKIKRMGFNAVLLDSKAWQDFQDRYRGGDASPYVAMQEYMMDAAQKEGLAYWHLALYLNGDNLYPNIRFSPPIYGESVTNADGADGKWYKYWSETAKDSMEAHVRGLIKAYGENQARIVVDGEERMPICSMWDPIVAPSFDAEGQARYIGWVKRHYSGDIALLNKRYHLNAADFSALKPEEYWFAPDAGCYAAEDLQTQSPAFWRWADNMMWKRDELIAYFADMQKRLAGLGKRLYLSPDMAQWSYYLNVDASKITGIGFSDLWDTAMRGIDIYSLAPYVDNCHFYTVPVTMDGDPDAYAVSCQHAMMRAMNETRPFLGGMYWGRFLYNDVYRFISPAEIIGSMAAAGAMGYESYGFCGLDDGGILHRMDEGFTRALEMGNVWFKRVVPKLKGERQKDVAILFPSAMSLLKPLSVKGCKAQRLDLLGWFTALCDMGYAPDVLSEKQAAAGALGAYKAVILPANDCYFAMPDKALEGALAAFAHQGGTVFHGAWDQIAQAAFGLSAVPAPDKCFDYHGGGLLMGESLCAYPGETVAVYRESGLNCLARTAMGQGQVYSLGFMYGYSMAAKTAPHVPLSQRNNALYPVTHLKRDPVREALSNLIAPKAPVVGKGIESARFGNDVIIVNHTPHPVYIPPSLGKMDFQYETGSHMLMGHSAVFVTSK